MRRSSSWRFGAALVVVLAAACADERRDGHEGIEGSPSAGFAGALDEAPDPDEGKTCYQDVPMRKGKMEMGMCCFDDPVKGTSHCVKCDAEHHCQVGGAEPGALVRDDRATVIGGLDAVLEPAPTTPISPVIRPLPISIRRGD